MRAARPIRLIIVDDHPMFRDALRAAFWRAYPSIRVAEAHCLAEASDVIRRDGPFNLALLDLHLPGSVGLEALLTLRSKFRQLPVVIVSATEDRRVIREAISFGAAGYIPKSSTRAELLGAIRQIMKGEIYLPAAESEVGVGSDASADLARRVGTLTPQQVRVLFLLMKGLLNKQIACELGIGEPTVKRHVTGILRKLRVFSRTQAVIAMAGATVDRMQQGNMAAYRDRPSWEMATTLERPNGRA